MESYSRTVRQYERHFYLDITAIFLIVVLWAFARAFYLKLFFGTPSTQGSVWGWACLFSLGYGTA